MMPSWLVDAALVLLALQAVGALGRGIRRTPETSEGAIGILIAVALFAIEVAAVGSVWK